MATLRRYSIVKTRKYSKFWSPDRAILLAFCAAVGGGVFMTMSPMQRTQTDKQDRFAGVGVGVPIAAHLAEALDRAGKRRRIARPSDDPNYARSAAERARRAAIAAQLAEERRRTSARLFKQRNNVDRTPVASIPLGARNNPQAVLGGFRAIAAPPSGVGFREIPSWRKPGT